MGPSGHARLRHSRGSAAPQYRPSIGFGRPDDFIQRRLRFQAQSQILCRNLQPNTIRRSHIKEHAVIRPTALRSNYGKPEAVSPCSYRCEGAIYASANSARSAVCIANPEEASPSRANLRGELLLREADAVANTRRQIGRASGRETAQTPA